MITMVLLLLHEGAGEERAAADCEEGGRRNGAVATGRRSSREGTRRGHLPESDRLKCSFTSGTGREEAVIEEAERRKFVPSRITEGRSTDVAAAMSEPDELQPLTCCCCCCRRCAGAKRADVWWEGFVERSRGIRSSLGGCVVGRGGGMRGTDASREAAAEAAAALLSKAANSASLSSSGALRVLSSAA